MNFLQQYADSVQFNDLRDSVAKYIAPRQAEEDDEVEPFERVFGQILLETQASVNAFLASFGANLVSEYVADTFMLVGEVFSTEQRKVFSVVAMLHNRSTDKIFSYVIQFRLYLPVPGSIYLPGLVVEQN